MRAAERTCAGERDHAGRTARSSLSTPNIPGCDDPSVLSESLAISTGARRGSGIPSLRSSASSRVARDGLASLGPRHIPAPLLRRHRDRLGRLQAPDRVLGPRRPGLSRHRLGNRMVRRPASTATTPTRRSASRRSLETGAVARRRGRPCYLSILPAARPADARDAAARRPAVSTSTSSPCPGRRASARPAARRRPASNAQTGSGLGFVTHGLWPQYGAGLSELLRARRPLRAARGDRRVRAASFPDENLARYQWRKHGTLHGREPERLFPRREAGAGTRAGPGALAKARRTARG